MGSRPADFVARFHLRFGRALAWWGWPSLAIQAHRDAIRRAPQMAEAHAGLGDALSRVRRWDEAGRALCEAARLRPSSAEIQGNLVLALGRGGRWSDALQALDRLIHLRPHEGELHVLRGAVLRKLGRRHEAIRAFRWAVQLPPPADGQRSFLGPALLGAGEWDALARSYRGAVVAFGDETDRPAPGLRQGSALNRPPAPIAVPTMARRGGARPFLRAPLGVPRAFSDRARRASGVLGRAADALFGWSSLVLSRDLSRRPSADSTAWSLRQARRVGLAGRSATGALLVLLLASAVTAAGRVDTLEANEQARLCVEQTKRVAVEGCRRALELGLSPKRAYWIRRVFAGKLEGLERWDEAVATYRDQVRLDPTDADARARLGSVLLYAKDEPEEAAALLRDALRLAPEDARAEGDLGVALNALGRFDESVAAFEEAVRLDGSYLDGRPAARRVLEASRKGEKWP